MFVYACVSAMHSEVSLVWVVWETKKPGITGVFNRVGIYNMDASLEKWKINLNDVRRIFSPHWFSSMQPNAWSQGEHFKYKP